MNEQESKRDQRGVFFRHQDGGEGSQASGGSSEKGGTSSFIRNNLEHEKMGTGFYKTIASILLAIVGGSFFIGYRASSITRDEISKVVNEVVPNVKFDPDGPTLRRQMYIFESDIKECKQMGPRIIDIEKYINSKGRK